MNRHYGVPVETVQSYTERPELWKELEEKLQVRHEKARVPHAVALQGLGGVGKSQLALKYAESKKHQYNPILWIDVTDEETTRSSFRRCAAELGLPDYQDQKQALADSRTLQGVLRWLGDREGTDDEWLVIVDNADDLSLAVKDALPKGDRGSIIITSQDNWSHMLIQGGCERVDVGVMSPQEGTTLLLQRLDMNEEATTDAIRSLCAQVADELGHLPLAIDLAGAYIGNDLEPPEIALKQYLEDFTAHRDELLKTTEFQGLVGTEKTVWTAWDTTLRRITNDTVQPLILLRLLAQFKGTIIQDELFRLAALAISRLGWLSEVDAITEETSVQHRQYLPVKEGKWDSFLYRQHRELLVRYGLLQRVLGDWPGVTMHKLVQWRATQSDQNKQWAWRHIFHVVAVCTQILEPEHPPDFRRHLVVHIPDVDTAFDAMSGDVQNCRAPTCALFASVYYEEGRWKEAERMFTRTVESAKALFGPDAQRTAVYMAELAKTHFHQRQWDKAEELQLQAIELLKTRFGDSHVDTLWVMKSLVSTYRMQHRFEEAEKLLVQVIESQKTKLGPDHPDVLASKRRLVTVYTQKRQLEDAETLQLRVIEASKSILGADHADTIDAQLHLSVIYKLQGKLEKAETLNWHVMETCKMKFGVDHPSTLRSMDCLVSVYSFQGRFEEAQRLGEEALEGRRKTSGTDHPNSQRVLHHLVTVYIAQTRWEEAEKLLLQVINNRKTTIGPEMLECIEALADIYRRQGKLEEAERLLLQGVEASKTNLGPDHPDTLARMFYLGTIYADLGRLEEAEKLSLHVREIFETKLGHSHPRTLRVIEGLAYIRAKMSPQQDMICPPQLSSTD